MRSLFFSFVLAFSMALLVSSPALAQVGGIAGTIKDSTGAVLPGARVELQNGPAAVSDGQGQFTMTNVALGTRSFSERCRHRDRRARPWRGRVHQ